MSIPVEQDVLDELRRAEPRERRRERQDGNEQRSAVGQRVELFVVGREQHRRRRRIDDLERMRPERDEDGRGSPCADARSCRSAQDVAVSEVHAVERADGDDRSAGELRKAERVRHREARARAAARRRRDRRPR